MSPPMDERFQRVCELFEAARRLPAGSERARFLAASCEGELRTEVESMLAHHERKDSILDLRFPGDPAAAEPPGSGTS